MTRRGLLASVCAIAAVAASCGVPTGPDSFEPIDGSDIPNRLNETTTTTTTTTTPTPATTTTVAAENGSDQNVTTTTTEPEIPTEIVQIFYVSRGQLRAQPTEALSPVTATDLKFLLEARPLSDLLDNEIDLNLIESTSIEEGVITIELDDRVFQRIPVRDQREAIAQIVLTFLTNLRGVGQAIFTIDGDRLIVPVGNGQSTDEPVSLDDYESMLVDAEPDEEPAEPTPTEPPATEPPTTEPAETASTEPPTTGS